MKRQYLTTFADVIILISMIVVPWGCGNGKHRTETSGIESSGDSDANPFIQYPSTPFGNFDVFATSGVPEAKVTHAAGVFSQWLDNDENGVADNPAVYAELVKKKIFMALVDDENAEYDEMVDRWIPKLGMDYRPYFGAYGTEIYPDAITDGVVVGPHCGTWEEFWHLISDEGYAAVYPSVFGLEPGTELCNAMDIARGGQFFKVPKEYPEDAWYFYYDRTCDYNCQAGEYFYWLLGTILGAHDFSGDIFGSCEQIQQEWIPCNRDELQSIDPAGYRLITDPQYKLPTVLPDGHYDKNGR